MGTHSCNAVIREGEAAIVHILPHRVFPVKVMYKSGRCQFINTPPQLYFITKMGSHAVNGCLRTKINLTYRRSAALTVVNMSEF